MSSTDEILFNFDPPQTIQTDEVDELTRVHFLQVHSRSVVVGLDEGAEE